MITASGSSRLTAEAMPVPSASIARWIRSSARWSLASIARSQMPLVRRGLSCFSISLKRSVLWPSSCWRRASASIAERPGVGLHAALAPAGALGAAALDDHVADLAGGAAAQPGLAVEDEAAADAGAPEDADQALELAPGAEVELGLGRDLDVVADPDLGAQRLLQSLRQREAALPAGQVAGAGDDAGLLVGVAGRADPDALQRRRSRPRPARPPRAAPPPSRWRRPAGPPLVGVGRRDSPLTSPPASTIAVWIFVPPRSMPPRSSATRAVYASTGRCPYGDVRPIGPGS